MSVYKKVLWCVIIVFLLIVTALWLRERRNRNRAFKKAISTYEEEPTHALRLLKDMGPDFPDPVLAKKIMAKCKILKAKKKYHEGLSVLSEDPEEAYDLIEESLPDLPKSMQRTAHGKLAQALRLSKSRLQRLRKEAEERRITLGVSRSDVLKGLDNQIQMSQEGARIEGKKNFNVLLLDSNITIQMLGEPDDLDSVSVTWIYSDKFDPRQSKSSKEETDRRAKMLLPQVLSNIVGIQRVKLFGDLIRRAGANEGRKIVENKDNLHITLACIPMASLRLISGKKLLINIKPQ